MRTSWFSGKTPGPPLLAVALLVAATGTLTTLPAPSLGAGDEPGAAGASTAPGLARGGPGLARGGPTPPSFHRDVRPILQRRCQGCHQPAKPGGKLDVTTFAALLAGGKRGAGFIAGNPADSILIQYVTGEKKPRMPKGEAPLAGEEIALLTRWVAEGGTDDTPASAGLAPGKPPVYTAPPVVSSLAYSPDGQLLATAGYHEVILHRADGSERLARLAGVSDRIETLLFSPDGKLLAAAGGSPGRFGEVQIWDPGERQLLQSVIVGFDSLYGAAFSDDGKLIAFGSTDRSAQILSVEEGKVIRRIDQHEDWVFGTAFSKDQKNLITASRDRALKLIEADTGSFIDNITSITPGVLGGPLFALARHPTEDRFLTGGEDGIPKLYKIVRTAARQIGDDNNLLKAYEKVPGVITCLAVSPDGKRFAAGSIHGDVKVHDIESGRAVASIALENAIYTVRFNHDGTRLAAGGFDGKVRIHEAASGKLEKEFVPVPLGRQEVAREF